MSATSRAGRAAIRAASFLSAGQMQNFQRIGNGLQVSLRQVQILSGGLQIAVAKQYLNGAQIGACFQ
jgi:hypothetical protein